MPNEKRKYHKSTLLLYIKIQEMYTEKKKGSGRSDVYIHQNYIEPNFGICIRTMQRALETPATRHLRALNKPTPDES